jgi:EAL domain-containing protein (putative c-di-GMP-specific phosphodiesterase class I)
VLQRELELGLAHSQLRVHYHATVSLTTGRIAGFEALLRWKHPRRGLLLPQDFMGVAEESGLMVPMGHWVIREACRFARLLGRDGGESPPAVSVNLSPRQLGRRDVVDQVHGILKETEVSGRRLRFELTEAMILDDLDGAARKLSRLKEMGIAVDIDDFGLGYASLNFLRALPIDAVKIDRTIVDRMGSEPADLAMVRSVVQITRRLGLTSVAEGVRRQEDVDQLGRIGCQYGQGYFFSPPVHAPGARGLLAHRWPSAVAPPRRERRALAAPVPAPPRPEPVDRGYLGDPSHLPALLERLDRLDRFDGH